MTQTKKDLILDKLDRLDDSLNRIAEEGDYQLVTLVQRAQEQIDEIREILE